VSEVLLLAVRERWVNLTVTLNGVPRTFKVRGRAVRIIIYLPKRRDRVKFLERIRVGSHLEKVSFTRIYHRC
jgi:hypothetical protein